MKTINTKKTYFKGAIGAFLDSLKKVKTKTKKLTKKEKEQNKEAILKAKEKRKRKSEKLVRDDHRSKEGYYFTNGR